MKKTDTPSAEDIVDEAEKRIWEAFKDADEDERKRIIRTVRLLGPNLEIYEVDNPVDEVTQRVRESVRKAVGNPTATVHVERLHRESD